MNNKLNIKELADILKTNKSLEFQYKNLHYQIFESSELGYCLNVYSSNDKDENGDYLDSNLVDGGVCTGSAKDAVEFLL
ncbi:hypothetical protein [Halarcobacter anaerophilus]|uniref:hypothetical protein n=1 Tax=Halarcobacter anaerophilus TaxID=877500 RepID=UPI0005C8B02A|nr:hypothetical protein [Halarcobacter anaerophilus]